METTAKTDASLIPQVNKDAAKVLERLINNKLFAHGDPHHAQFLTGKVEIGVGLDNDHYLARKDDVKPQEVIRIRFKDPHVEMVPSKVQDVLKDVLKSIPGIADAVSFESEKEHSKKLKDTLAEFKDQGANIPENTFEWRGFADNLDTKGWQSIDDHALKVNKNIAGIYVDIDIPKGKDDDKKDKGATQKVAENIRARLPQIKEVLLQRVIKYTPGMDEATKCALTERFNKLEFTVSNLDSEYSNNVTIHIQSPEQAKEKDAKHGELSKKQVELDPTNPLNALSKEHLGKALGRAVLHAGETAGEIFPLIAGREDMKRAIGKALTRFKAEKPDMAAKVDAFLADDLFKNQQGWENRQDLKQAPRFNKDPDKAGELTVDLKVSADKAASIIEAIAGLDKQHGAHTAQQAPIIIINQAAAAAAPGAAVENALKPFAQDLIGHVKAAYQSIEAGLEKSVSLQTPAATANGADTLASITNAEKAVDAAIAKADALLNNLKNEKNPPSPVILGGAEIFCNAHSSTLGRAG